MGRVLSLIFPRLVSPQHDPLRAYAVIEFGISACGILILLLMPLVGGIYTVWSGYGFSGFLVRGVVAAACLLPPTLLMGATLPALARCVKAVQPQCLVVWLSLCREHSRGGVRLLVIGILFVAGLRRHHHDPCRCNNQRSGCRFCTTSRNRDDSPLAVLPLLRTRLQAPQLSGSLLVCVAIGLSGFCALAAESICTRLLGLLFGASVYTLSIILAVFLAGLGIGSSIGSSLARSVERPRVVLGWCQLLVAGAIAWTSYALSASLPYWPINPSISSDIWFNFQLDLDRAFWALLPPTVLWGASFRWRFRASDRKKRMVRALFAGFMRRTRWERSLAVECRMFLIAWVGSQRTRAIADRVVDCFRSDDAFALGAHGRLVGVAISDRGRLDRQSPIYAFRRFLIC